MIQWLVENQDFATLLFTAVVAISTVVYALLTAFLVRETAQMRRAQTEPRLSAYFLPKEEFVNFGHLYIKNIGLGPAYNIRVSIEPEGSAAGSELLLKDFLKVKAFEKGLNYLGPGQILRSGFTSMVENYQEKINAVLHVSLSYKSADGKKKSETFRVDFSELEGYGSLGKPHLYSIAQSLEKIERDIHHLSSGFHKLKVHTFDHEDREREKREWEEDRQQMMQKKEQKDG
ncbi:MAG: hypothetical protein IT488_12650 [Gammaproteobacteria bacterium]|nr:hypothetical protein [Gammaproteobacteria bacterium]